MYFVLFWFVFVLMFCVCVLSVLSVLCFVKRGVKEERRGMKFEKDIREHKTGHPVIRVEVEIIENPQQLHKYYFLFYRASGTIPRSVPLVCLSFPDLNFFIVVIIYDYL